MDGTLWTLLWLSTLTVIPKITVYQDKVAWVLDPRSVVLEKGSQSLIFRKLPRQVDPTSIRLELPNAQVLSLRYQTPSLELQDLYDQTSGKPIRIFLKSGQTLEAQYVTTTSGGLLVTFKGELTYLPQGQITRVDFPSLQTPTERNPFLRATVEAQQPGKAQATLSYLTQGLSWQAYYDAVLDENETLTFSGWITLTNTSGKTFKHADLQLVAGTIHRAQPSPPPRLLYAEQGKATPQVPLPQALFEYHLYPFPRPVTLLDGASQQLQFLDPHRIPAKKVYVYEGDEQVKVKIEFQNKKETGLGTPLPAGLVRVYKKDPQESPVFIGEDQIHHTPAGATVRLYVGDAFDLRGETKVVRSQKIREHVREEERKIRLRNQKDQPVTITVVQKFFGDWEIVSSTVPYKKRDAYTVEFQPTVPAKGETVIHYTVRWYW